MTERDSQPFALIYAAVLVGLRHSVSQEDAGVDVYFSALKDLPIEAVVQSGRGYLSEPGREWVPTTGEWYAAADELAISAFEAMGGTVVEPDRLLAGSVQEKAERMARIKVARQKFVEQVRAISPKAATRFDEGVPLNDPENYYKRAHCPVCHDHGLVAATQAPHQQPSSKHCICISNNPVIKAAAERRRLACGEEVQRDAVLRRRRDRDLPRGLFRGAA